MVWIAATLQVFPQHQLARNVGCAPRGLLLEGTVAAIYSVLVPPPPPPDIDIVPRSAWSVRTGGTDCGNRAGVCSASVSPQRWVCSAGASSGRLGWGHLFHLPSPPPPGSQLDVDIVICWVEEQAVWIATTVQVCAQQQLARNVGCSPGVFFPEGTLAAIDASRCHPPLSHHWMLIS